MEWKNKGKEFEKYREVFENKQIFIYGAAERGYLVYQMLKFLNLKSRIKGFIDRKGEMFEADNLIRIMRFTEVSLEEYSNSIIILAAQCNNMTLFAKQLRKLGLIEGKNFFYYDDFMEYYINIFAFYACNIVYASFISMQVSSVCNLKCKGCVAFTPENSMPCHFELKKNVENADSIFSNIDRVNLLDVCGGEPFLNENFGKIIHYIGQNYRNKINILRTVTNGTIVPDEKLCRILKDNNVTVVLDDYRENVERAKYTFLKVKEQLERFSIPVVVRKAERWIDLGIDQNKIYEDKKVLIKIHSECSNPIRSVHDKKLYCCDYADFARASGKYKAYSTDYLDLSIIQNKAVIMEFLMGYTELGYCGMCKCCSGCTTINDHYIPVAEQIINK